MFDVFRFVEFLQHKTATTSLQIFLGIRARAILEEQDRYSVQTLFNWPAGPKQHCVPSFAHFLELWGDDHHPQCQNPHPTNLTTWIQQQQQQQQHVLISFEEYAAASTETLAAVLKRIHQGTHSNNNHTTTTIRIVIYYRPFAEWFESIYHEKFKYNWQGTYPSFVDWALTNNATVIQQYERMHTGPLLQRFQEALRGIMKQKEGRFPSVAADIRILPMKMMMTNEEGTTNNDHRHPTTVNNHTNHLDPPTPTQHADPTVRFVCDYLPEASHTCLHALQQINKNNNPKANEGMNGLEARRLATVLQNARMVLKLQKKKKAQLEQWIQEWMDQEETALRYWKCLPLDLQNQLVQLTTLYEAQFRCSRPSTNFYDYSYPTNDDEPSSSSSSCFSTPEERSSFQEQLRRQLQEERRRYCSIDDHRVLSSDDPGSLRAFLRHQQQDRGTRVLVRNE